MIDRVMKVSEMIKRVKKVCEECDVDLQKLVPMSKSNDRGTLISFYGRENDNTYVCVRKIGGVPIAFVAKDGGRVINSKSIL